LVVFSHFTTPAYAAIEVETKRIGHGVSVWYAASPHVPVVDIQLVFEGAGYASDPAGREGRAALAAAMLMEGAGTLDALAFQRALDDGALQLNASVTTDQLVIHLHGLRDQVQRGGELLALALAQPQFAPTDLSRMKTTMQAQLAQMQETPDYQAMRLFDTTAFAGHPYANPIYGTAESLGLMTANDLRQYLTTYATRGNLRIAAAGDVDDDLLDAILTPVVEALREGDAATSIASVTLKGSGSLVRQAMAVPQTSVQFALPSVARDDPKFYAAYVLNHILGGNGLVSRLADRVRQQQGLVYGIGTELDVRRGISLLRGEFATRTATTSQAVDAVKQVMTELRDKGITSQECEDAKTYVIGATMLRLDSSQQVANMLMVMQVQNLGEDYLEKREGYFAAVKCADLNALAAEMLDPAKLLIAVVGDEAPTKVTP
jgi:zinc protease